DVVDDADDLVSGNDAANRLADVIAERRRLLDARAGRRSQVQLELSAVDAGEKVLADPAHQDGRRHACREKDERERTAPRDRRGERPAVGVADTQEHAVDSVLQPHERVAARRLAVRARLMRAQRVLRQLPRKMRIISAVRQAAITASRTTPSIEARTKSD